MLKTRKPVPDTKLPLVGGGTWSVKESAPENLTMMVVYRGLHCPLCKGYLGELAQKRQEFASRGVDVVCVSTDDEERAARAVQDWGLEGLKMAYGMSIDQAREWGLYISTSRGKTSLGIEEPALFAEPGIFLIKPDGTLYAAFIQSTPFARPHFDDLLKAIDFITSNDYPARGEA